MTSCSCLLYLYMVFLALFSHGFQNSFQCCIQHFKPIESSTCQINPVDSSENFVLHNFLYHITPIVKVLCKFSSITMSYPNLGLNSYSTTLLVPMSENLRPTSHHTVLCIFHSSRFLTKCIIMAMCMVCLVSFSLLDIHTSYLLSTIIRGACYGTTYGFLFISSLFRILKCANSIPELND